MAKMEKTLNFNVGMLGHVDSGKTSIAKALSSTASTAAFDKNPQSKERGITLDLGFSAFSVPSTPALLQHGYTRLQFTLVDCPGHASLIRTIIGDVTKGMQTQSAECLLIGEMTCPKMVVVLNKTDLFPDVKCQALVEKMTRKMQKTLENTRFKGAPIISIAAKPGGTDGPENESPEGISQLTELLLAQVELPQRDSKGPFLMAVDHCFSVRGQGTVMTGTVLSGGLSLHDTIEIPALKVTKKVKSLQMFRQPVDHAIQGDRLGICVTQFDPGMLERGLVCSPGSLRCVYAAIATVRRVPYFRGTLRTRASFHTTIGHDTVLARATFFAPAHDLPDPDLNASEFNFSSDYRYVEEYGEGKDASDQASNGSSATAGHADKPYWVLLEFVRPVACPHRCKVIASRLDTDIHANACRLAFHGVLLVGFEEQDYATLCLPRLRIYKEKHKEGIAERANGEHEVIGRALFKKETNMSLFIGLHVSLSTGEHGIIEGSFGQSGKFKIRIPEGLTAATMSMLSSCASKKKGKLKNAEEEPKGPRASITITLAFRRYIFDPKKQMVQS
uniref:selenocysteine-specific elongation factor isoform X2 n=1 Tax=Myxine glutinosa TaxID=7769 RepID=UPI00358F7958